jgi:hypothetical protein
MLLKRAGHDIKMWVVFLVPVYLWKRAEVLKQGKGYFILWIVLAVLRTLAEAGRGA